jgi:hypothetical protein
MATNSLSTRVTFKHIGLARELALANGPDTASRKRNSSDQPVVRLADQCLRVSESLLQGGRKGLDLENEESDIAEVLSSATADRPAGNDRIGLALAALHFVERTLGLAKRTRKRGRKANVLTKFADGRMRSQNCGTYSTPDYIVDSMLQEMFDVFRPKPKMKLDVLDLSLEGGHFALSSMQRAARDKGIRFYGIDEDPAAIALADRILRFAARGEVYADFSFKLSCCDSLIDSLPRGWPKQFDAVVGNPPWTGRKSNVSEALRRKFWPLLRGRYDLYLAFMLTAHSLLKPGGLLSYVVPSGFLFNATAGSVRRLLLGEYDILSLTTYSQRSFIEVPCIIPISFLARKKSLRDSCVVPTRITNADTGLGGANRPRGRSMVRIVDVWKRLPDCGMNPVARSETEFLASDLPGIPLERFGRVSSGARLGTARRQCSPIAFTAIHACDLRPFHACLRRRRVHRRGDAVFDRSPDRHAIESEKVVFQELRFMTHERRLVAAGAMPGTLPVSTAGLFLPDEPKDSLYFVALLNSTLANAWYKLRDVNRAVKISYLRSLPILKDLKTWHFVTALAQSSVELRTFFHKRLSSCTVRNEWAWLSTKFPKEWHLLAENQAAIDEKIFTLYNIPKGKRLAVVRLANVRVF